jgi:putative redox protein
MSTGKLEFEGGNGALLAARLDLPELMSTGRPRAYAIFAHCFTCSKDLNATRRISAALAAKGIAVLRFDFTGLGSSEGEFASTNFSTNIADLLRAADLLRRDYEAPSLLIGHSLGGAAVLVAAGQIPELKGVVTIGAPADANHVIHNFAANLEHIKSDGKADVSLGGRKFTIQKQFLDDLAGSAVKDHVAKLKKPLLIFHSPLDQTVGIENAAEIFGAAKHPKSFISLDKADHLVTSPSDADFIGSTIAAWSARYFPAADTERQETSNEGIVIRETGYGKFQNAVRAGKHNLLADEPAGFGGTDTGPSPYDFLSIALGACTTMTLRMYSDRKQWDIGQVSVTVDHDKVHATDCADCDEATRHKDAKIDRFHRQITVRSGLDNETMQKLLEIADKCPVHRTLHQVSSVETSITSK